MMTTTKIAVSEYFYSLQGEGRTMGIPAIFVRLTGCNLMCGGFGVERDGQLRDGATWVCDTIAVWLRGTMRPIADWVEDWNRELQFVERLRRGAHLVITGGEPLLQQERIVALLEYLEQQFQLQPIVEIETNATVLPLTELDRRVAYWNTSPKLRNSGMPADRRLRPDVLRWFAQNPNTMTKLVIANREDWTEIETDLLAPELIRRDQIVLMPSADSLDNLLKTNKLVAEICIEQQLRMSTRLHVEIWNQLTGV